MMSVGYPRYSGDEILDGFEPLPGLANLTWALFKPEKWSIRAVAFLSYLDSWFLLFNS